MSLKARQLVKGSIFRVSEFFVSAVVGLVMMPFIIHTIGDKMYGLWVLIGTFMGYYGLFDFGLMQAVQRFISRAIGIEDNREANVIINTTLSLYFLIGLLILLFSLLLVLLAPYVIKNTDNLRLFRIIISLLSLSLAIGFPMRVFKGVIIAHLRYDLNTSTEIVAHIFRVILVFTFLKRYNSILTLAIIAFVTETLMYIMTFIFAKRVYGKMVLAYKLVKREKIKSIFKYSFVSAAANIALMMRFRISSFIIAGFLGLREVAIYSISLRLVEYFSQAMNSSMGVLMPVFSQYEGKNDYAAIREKYQFTTKISGYVALLIGGILILFGRTFIERWMGASYLGAYPVLVVLISGFIFSAMQTPAAGLLFGISKHKFFVVAHTIEGIANLILSLLLVRKYGLIGIAMGVAIPLMIMKLFVEPIYVCKVINLKLKGYYLQTIVPVMMKSIGVFSLLWYVSRNFLKPSYLNLSVNILAGTIVFAVLIFKFGFDEMEKGVLWQSLKKRK